MKLLVKRLASAFGFTVKGLAVLSAAALASIMLLVGVDVAMRYMLNRPLGHVLEISEHLLVFLTFLAAAWVAQREGHAKVDIVLNRLNPEARAIANFIASITSALVCLILAWYGARVSWNHFQAGAFFRTVLRLPQAPIMAIIFIGYLLLSIQFLRNSYEGLGKWRAWRGKGQKS